MYALTPDQIRPAAGHQPRSDNPRRQPTHYTLTLLLNGITNDDYLQWVRDPDPPDRNDLKLLAVRSAGLGNCLELDLISDGEPLPPSVSAHAVGFPVTRDVAAVRCSLRAPSPMSARQDTGMRST